MDMHSDLEFVVASDMIENGFNPYCKEDIELYWEERLDGN
mgnify:CR=1 FL=1